MTSAPTPRGWRSASDDYRLPCGHLAGFTATQYARVTGEDPEDVRRRMRAGELATVRSGRRLLVDGTEACRVRRHRHLAAEGVEL